MQSVTLNRPYKRSVLPLDGQLNPTTPTPVEGFRGNLPPCAPPCFLANQIEWKQRGSDRKVRAASLIVSDCLVYFPRPCPPISPVIYVRLGQSRSRVAMARDCLHPVMLYSHVGTHSLQRALLFVYHLFRRTPPSRCPKPFCRFKTGPRLHHRPWLKRSVAACFTPSHQTCVLFLTAWSSISGALKRRSALVVFSLKPKLERCFRKCQQETRSCPSVTPPRLGLLVAS